MQFTISPIGNQAPAGRGQGSTGAFGPLESGVQCHLEPLALLPMDVLSPLPTDLGGCGLGGVFSIHYQVKLTQF